jgi:transcription antitermination factor NusG
VKRSRVTDSEQRPVTAYGPTIRLLRQRHAELGRALASLEDLARLRGTANAAEVPLPTLREERHAADSQSPLGGGVNCGLSGAGGTSEGRGEAQAMKTEIARSGDCITSPIQAEPYQAPGGTWAGESLLERGDSVVGPPWYALQVRARAESSVEWCLRNKGYETFLPSIKQSRRYFDRLKVINVAVFPGYLFCRLDIRRRLPILTTPGVGRIVGRGGVPEPVLECEVESLIAMVRSGVAAQPWPYMHSGDRVRIAFGAFAGTEGILVSEKGLDRLVVSVTLLQRSVAFEIERSWVQPASAVQPARHAAM